MTRAPSTGRPCADGSTRLTASRERAVYDPTYGGYFLGKRGILKLRADYQAKMGAEFNLRAFHERVMSNGIAPIRAHRMLMLSGDTGAVIR